MHPAGHLIDVPNPTLGVAFFGCHLLYPLLVLLPIPVLGPLIPELFYLASAPGIPRDEVRSGSDPGQLDLPRSGSF